MLAENVNHTSAGLQKKFGLQSEESALEFTLPPHNDGATRRVSVPEFHPENVHYARPSVATCGSFSG